MSYFEHTKADVANANLAGKKDLARMLSAIVLDTDAKMDDPDSYDREYVLEDLLGRIVSTIAPFASETFEPWQDHRLAYPEMLARDESGIVRPFIAHHADTEFVTKLAEDTEAAIREVLANRRPGPMDAAIRETWALQRWDGVSRHRFEGSFTGNVCGAMVERRGFGEDCGLPATHLVHETEYPG